MTKQQSLFFKNFLKELNEKHFNYNFSNNKKKKLSDCILLIKDEFKEIEYNHRLHKPWSSYCFNEFQCFSILRLCDYMNIPYSYKFFYDEFSDSLNYIEITNK